MLDERIVEEREEFDREQGIALCTAAMPAAPVSWVTLLPAGLFKRLGRSLLVHLERISLVRWQSREETFLFFKGRPEPLTIGRYAAARLRELLDS